MIKRNVGKFIIRDLHWLDDQRLLVSFGDGGEILILDEEFFAKNNDIGGNFGNESAKIKKLLLPPGKERWTTAACLIENSDILAIGDRNGSVSVYDLKSESLDPTDSHLKIHGSKQGVTEFFRSKNGLLMSIGRDGRIRKWKAVEKKLRLIADDPVPMEWPAKFLKDSFGNLKFLVGFHGDRLIIFDVVFDFCVQEIFCGGGHRPWDVKIQNQNGLDLLFVKCGRTFQLKQKFNEMIEIQPHLHSRRINAAAFGSLNNQRYLIL